MLDYFYGPLTRQDEAEYIRDLQRLGLPDNYGTTYGSHPRAKACKWGRCNGEYIGRGPCNRCGSKAP